MRQNRVEFEPKSFLEVIVHTGCHVGNECGPDGRNYPGHDGVGHNDHGAQNDHVWAQNDRVGAQNDRVWAQNDHNGGVVRGQIVLRDAHEVGTGRVDSSDQSRVDGHGRGRRPDVRNSRSRLWLGPVG